jgi:hypothetical protein
MKFENDRDRRVLLTGITSRVMTISPMKSFLFPLKIASEKDNLLSIEKSLYHTPPLQKRERK